MIPAHRHLFITGIASFLSFISCITSQDVDGPLQPLPNPPLEDSDPLSPLPPNPPPPPKDAEHPPPPPPPPPGDLGTWHYLPITLPTPLSDSSVAVLSGFPPVQSSSSSSSASSSSKRMVITGGCNSLFGHEFVEFILRENCDSMSDSTLAVEVMYDHDDQDEQEEHTHEEGWNVKVEEMAVMPRKRARHASVVVDGKLYLIGGRDEADAIVAEIDQYDPVSNSWSTPGVLPDEYLTSDASAFAIGKTIYLVGGYNSDYEALDQVTLIDVSSPSNPLISPAAFHLVSERGDMDAAASPDGKHVFVGGGFTHRNNFDAPHSSVERFDLPSLSWSELPQSLGTPRGNKQLVLVKDKLYVLGGETKETSSLVVQKAQELLRLGEDRTVLSTVEVYDVKHGLWGVGPSMPEELCRFAAVDYTLQQHHHHEPPHPPKAPHHEPPHPEGPRPEGPLHHQDPLQSDSPNKRNLHDHHPDPHHHPHHPPHHEEHFIFVFGGQGAYDADCECFHSSNRILVYELPHGKHGLDINAANDAFSTFSNKTTFFVGVTSIISIMMMMIMA